MRNEIAAMGQKRRNKQEHHKQPEYVKQAIEQAFRDGRVKFPETFSDSSNKKIVIDQDLTSNDDPAEAAIQAIIRLITQLEAEEKIAVAIERQEKRSQARKTWVETMLADPILQKEFSDDSLPHKC